MPRNSAKQKEVRKRPKIALACEPCRERKVRCDGAKPVCRGCQRRRGAQDQCHYNLNVVSESGKAYIRILQDRICELENAQSPDVERSEPIQGWPHLPHPIDFHPSSDGPRSTSHFQIYEGAVQDDGSPSSSMANAARSLEAISRRSSSQTDVQSQSNAPASRHQTISLPQEQGVSRHEITSGAAPRSPEALPATSSNNFAVFNEEGTSPDLGGSINAMGTASAFLDHQPSRGYGSSSAVSFLQQIHRTLEDHPYNKMVLQSNENLSLGNRSHQRSDMRLIGRPPDIRLEDFSLPCRHLAEHLMKCYWEHVHTLYPFVHRPTFLAAYNKVWSGELDDICSDSLPNVGLGGSKCSAPVFFCALNSMLALGCHFSDVPLGERESLSASFFQRSMNLWHINIIDNGDIALLQTLLIIVQFLQSTSLPTRCWNTVGVAVRVAQGLGLHRNDSNFTKYSPLETEMRRRTWHGCVMLDLIVSMTLGRPPITYGKSATPLPLAIDDEDLDLTSISSSQPSNCFSQTTFFIQSIKLFQILGDILLKVYKPWTESAGIDLTNEERLQDTSIDTIIALDCALSDFEARVPTPLQWKLDQFSEAKENRVTVQQRNVLHARFLHLQILLYRPILNHLCRKIYSTARSTNLGGTTVEPEPVDRTSSILFTSLVTRCSTACTEAACELIELLANTAHSNVTGAWWYNVFYLFTSAMVLLLAELSELRDAPSQGSLDSSWQQCLNTLARISSQHIEAKQCATTLGFLRKQVSVIVERAPETSNPKKSSSQSSSDFQSSRSHQRNGTVGMNQDSEQAVLQDEQVLEMGFDLDFDDVQLRQMLNLNSGIFPSWNVEDMSSWGVPLFDQHQ